MGQRYFKSRSEAGQLALDSFAHLQKKQCTVIAINTDSLIIAAQLSQYLQCPLQLYLANDVTVPGSRVIGGVNSNGNFSYSTELSSGDADYVYQEFRSYIEEGKRSEFSKLNRELGSQVVIRKELIRKRNIVLVADTLENTVSVDSFMEFVKPFGVQTTSICSPIIADGIIYALKKNHDLVYYSSMVSFFYGKDHYYEDNKVYERQEGIDIVANYLKLWPAG